MPTCQAKRKKRCNYFYFVVNSCCLTSYAKLAWAVCPKSLMFSYLEESIGTLRFTLIFFANSIALA